MPVSYSISHSIAVRKALDHDTRVLSLPAATPDQLVRGGAKADFEAQAPIVRAVAERLTAASAAHGNIVKVEGGHEAGKIRQV